MKIKGISFKVRMLMIGIVPLVVASILLTVISITTQDSSLHSEYESRLQATCQMLMDTYRVNQYGVDNLSYDEASDTITINGSTDEGFQDMFEKYKAETGIDVTLFVGKTRRATSIEGAVGTDASDAVIKNVITDGKSFTSDSVKIHDIRYFVYYLPIKDASGDVLGMFFAGIPMTDFSHNIAQLVIKNVVVALLITLIAAAVIFLLLTKIAGMLNSVADMNSRMASGDFTAKADDKALARKDEIGMIARSAADLESSLGNMIVAVREKADVVDESSHKLTKFANDTSDSAANVTTAVNEIATGATSQAESVQSGVKSIGGILENVSVLTDDICIANDKADSMKTASAGMIKSFDDLDMAMNETAGSLTDVKGSMDAVSAFVDEVQSAAEAIKSISDQTNLLSLNASIEAARAGENGRGFAVVASEIGTLAAQSKQSAESIAKTMHSLTEKSQAAVFTVDSLSGVVNRQQDISNATRESINTVAVTIDEVKSTFDGITAACTDIKSMCETVNDTMEALSAISEENAASSEETAASMEQVSQTVNDIDSLASDLSDIVTQLTGMMAKFTVASAVHN